MEWLHPLAAFVIGLGLRLCGSLRGAILVVSLLRRLDARWQVGAEQRRALIAAGVARGPRCWELRNCPPERRANCLAYAQPGFPCWQVFRGSEGQLREACLECDVFTQAPLP